MITRTNDYSLAYYLGLMTSEYQAGASPKLLLWLEALLGPLIDAGTCASLINSSFDIEAAYGDQLDVLGVILGQSRTVNFQPSDGSSPTLDDTYYRTVLKAKVARNQWSGQLSELETLWANLFSDGAVVVVDNQNMTMSLTVAGSMSLLTQELIENGYIVPRPEGVEITYYYYGASIPLFGYGIYNSYFQGYGSGKWRMSTTSSNAIFSYDSETTAFKGYDEGYWD
jgi:hypothetical protein